mmetsp:Transcript_30092/g.65660  ORF Transcript_30092/g.65660 Transcript_30092/m.65660 type:complete len:240 (+) Transcript_30092:507-1226(+)
MARHGGPAPSRWRLPSCSAPSKALGNPHLPGGVAKRHAALGPWRAEPGSCPAGTRAPSRRCRPALWVLLWAGCQRTSLAACDWTLRCPWQGQSSGPWQLPARSASPGSGLIASVARAPPEDFHCLHGRPAEEGSRYRSPWRRSGSPPAQGLQSPCEASTRRHAHASELPLLSVDHAAGQQTEQMPSATASRPCWLAWLRPRTETATAETSHQTPEPGLKYSRTHRRASSQGALHLQASG